MLEDRRLLSLPSLPMGWGDLTRGMPAATGLVAPARETPILAAESTAPATTRSTNWGSAFTPEPQVTAAPVATTQNGPDSTRTAMGTPPGFGAAAPSSTSFGADQGRDQADRLCASSVVSQDSAAPSTAPTERAVVGATPDPVTARAAAIPSAPAAPDEVTARAAASDAGTAADGRGGNPVASPDAVEGVSATASLIRGTPAASGGRSLASVAPTARSETDPAAHATAPERSAGDPPLPATAARGDEADVAPGAPLPAATLAGVGSFAPRALPPLALAPPIGAAADGSPEATPGTVVRETGPIEGQPEAADPATARSGEKLAQPDARLADMIFDLMPINRGSLEGALDRILEPLDGLVAPLSGLNGPAALLAASLTLAAGVLALDVALRIRRARDGEDVLDGDADLVGWPGLPGGGRGWVG